MPSNKKVNVKVMENMTDLELNQLIDRLKKIEGFEFTLDSLVFISTFKNQNEVLKNKSIASSFLPETRNIIIPSSVS
jgi:hypothetical protein